MNTAQIQYVSNENGKPIAVIVPIEFWQQILADQETAYLSKSEAMKQIKPEFENKVVASTIPLRSH